MKKPLIALLVLSFAMSAEQAPAAVLWSFQQSGSDVVGTFSGSLNLTGATGAGLTNVSQPQMTPNIATIFSGADFTLEVDLYQVTGPTSFGAGVTTLASAASGASFIVSGTSGVVGVPEGYSSGTSIGGMITFANTSLAGLGITPADYVYALPNDTVTLRFGDNRVIPLPATLPLLLGGLGLSLAAVRRRA